MSYEVHQIAVAGGNGPVYTVIDGNGAWVFDKVFAWEADAREWALELTIGRIDDPRFIGS